MSAFAGNPYLISLDDLLSMDLVRTVDLQPLTALPHDSVDFGRLIPLKWQVLRKAYDKFKQDQPSEMAEGFREFRKAQVHWLRDFSLFFSIKTTLNGQHWASWPLKLRLKEPDALREFTKSHQDEISFVEFVQFLFSSQWARAKEYAHSKGISIIGDLPIFVAHDSADVWAHPELFFLNNDRQLTVVAGVPPDHFSSTGQRWGNPLYRWNIIEKDNSWWIQRFRHILTQVDFVRIDHFRGFEAYWEIAASEPTAVRGKWVKGPGKKFFSSLGTLGHLPVIAEDLGYITPAVHQIREKAGFPGMRILQYAFGDLSTSFSHNNYLPHNFDSPHTVCYTGSHDNDTTLGWIQRISQEERQKLVNYLGSNEKDVVGDLIRLAWSSTAVFAIIPLQDVLRLDNSARMNYPSTDRGNWVWRFDWSQMTDHKWEELREFSNLYNR